MRPSIEVLGELFALQQLIAIALGGILIAWTVRELLRFGQSIHRNRRAIDRRRFLVARMFVRGQLLRMAIGDAAVWVGVVGYTQGRATRLEAEWIVGDILLGMFLWAEHQDDRDRQEVVALTRSKLEPPDSAGNPDATAPS